MSDKQPTLVIADLVSVMEHIITEGEEEAFQSETEYRNAQNRFTEFMKYAKNWQKLEFVLSILGLITLLALVLIAVFRSRIIESIILSSAVMDEYKFVSPSQTSATAFTLLPLCFNNEPVQFQPPTLPQEWGESKHAVGNQKVVAHFTAWVASILIVLSTLAILYTIFKKCRYVSSLPRICFPLYPFSTILRGTMHTNIFIEVVNLLTAEAMWAHFITVAVHPSQLRISGYLCTHDMNIIKLCCFCQLQID